MTLRTCAFGDGVCAVLETGAHTPDPQLPPIPSPPNDPLPLDVWLGNPGAKALTPKGSPGPGPIGLELRDVPKGSGEGRLELGLEPLVRPGDENRK